MRLRTLIAIGALGGLVVGAITRLAGWSDDFSYVFSIAMLIVVLLVFFTLLARSDEIHGRTNGR